jgi:hydroxyacylglutathione hydrolase
MKIEQFFLEGLGHQSYFVADEESGAAAIVDRRRDIDVYLEAARRAGTQISLVLETHIHNDYVSGGRELAARTGAKIIASDGDPLVYADRSVREGDRISVGKAEFQVLHTPGHTPEHVSYLLYEQGLETPSSLFSGGSMLVGNAGRTDLLGPAHTLTLTRQQYATLRRLLDTLPGQVRVYPTHGAGSFCMSTSSSPARSTTIAQERLDEVPRNQPVALICRTGHRAEMAASIIAATGREVVVVGRGGVPDWAERGFPVTTEETARWDR